MGPLSWVIPLKLIIKGGKTAGFPSNPSLDAKTDRIRTIQFIPRNQNLTEVGAWHVASCRCSDTENSWLRVWLTKSITYFQYPITKYLIQFPRIRIFLLYYFTYYLSVPHLLWTDFCFKLEWRPLILRKTLQHTFEVATISLKLYTMTCTERSLHAAPPREYGGMPSEEWNVLIRPVFSL